MRLSAYFLPTLKENPAEAQIVSQGRGPQRGAADRGRATEPVTRSRAAQPSGLLAARAAEEYGYVVRDVRRIAIVAGTLLLVMIVLYVLIEVVRVVPGLG